MTEIRRLLLIAPAAEAGQPVAERTRAFLAFYEVNGIRCELYKSPSSLIQLLRLIIYIYSRQYWRVFITMPPFRNWLLFFLPGVRVMLDLRDGWSIAIANGYGGMIPPRPLTAHVARLVEQLCIFRSILTITVTPGLVDYHRRPQISKRLSLITNGYPDDALEFADRLRASLPRPQDGRIRFVCAGKFSEYGRDKVAALLQSIHAAFPNKPCHIDVIGADFNLQQWIRPYLDLSALTNITIDFLPRVTRSELLSRIVLADFGVVVLRNFDYEFGTKVFDYIMCGTPIFDYFDGSSSFHKFFLPALATSPTRSFSFDRSRFSRRYALEIARAELLHAVK